VEYRNPSPGVSVLIYKNDRVLIGKRSPGSFEAGKWCMPCGFVEYDEDFLSAASRETREECGLVVQLRSIIGVTCNFLAPSLHSIVVVFLAQPAGGTLAAGDDIVELQWAPMAGPFPELAFEADREIINRFAASPMQGLPIDSRFEANAQSDPVLTGIIKALL
jgi:ADP-ribose pyrophosphatase YjhB (NUDIX family)